MDYRIINIASDFSRYPGGRLITDGPHSGERFRKEYLLPVLKSGYQLKAGQAQSLTVRPELRACRAVEGWTVETFMVRPFDKLRTHHERP